VKRLGAGALAGWSAAGPAFVVYVTSIGLCPSVITLIKLLMVIYPPLLHKYKQAIKPLFIKTDQQMH
jgi:hypothetical protein